MHIKKHGKKYKESENHKETFKCDKCGCEFTAELDEYYVDSNSGFVCPDNPTITLTSNYYDSVTPTHTDNTKISGTDNSSWYKYTWSSQDTYVCSCPECHKIVTKRVLKTNPVITATYANVTNPEKLSCKATGSLATACSSAFGNNRSKDVLDDSKSTNTTSVYVDVIDPGI